MAELLAEVWRGRHVADGSVSVAVSAARRALGDHPARQRAIRTCRGRGYQFVLPIDTDTAGPDPCTEYSRNPASTDSNLVGRTRELAVVSAATTRILQKISTLLLISGEPGIGKTRLLDEVASIADASHLLFVSGRCAETGDAPAMWPWAQIFRALISRQSSNWKERINPRHLQSLAILTPEILPDFMAQARSSESADALRFQLYEGLLTSLLQLLGGQMSILALDDLHRADHSTLGFFRFAARELRHHPVILIGTHRISEVRNSAVHSGILADLAREPHAVSLRLEGLSPRETAQLFKDLSGTPASPRENDQVYQHTGGNPFFVRQLATLYLHGSKSPDDAPNASIPPTLRLAILEQIGALSQTARQVLAAAAVIGREFAPHILSGVAGVERAAVDDAMDELIDSKVLRRSADGPESFSFSHVLVRDALYEHLGLAERRSLHERIGRTLAVRYDPLSAACAGEIAYHLFEAKTPESLLESRLLSEAAAQAAVLRSAHDDAERHYLRALDALSQTEASNDEERCRLLLALGTEQCRSGNRAGAKKTFSSAALVARSLGASEALARAALGVAPGFLAAEAGASDAFLDDLLEDALTSLDPLSLSLRARLSARLAMALHWSNSPARMHKFISLALECSEAANDADTRLHIQVARWFCEWHHARFDDRSALADEIQAAAEQTRDREMILMGRMLRQVGMLERGEIAAFDSSLETFASLASDLRQPQSLWYTPLYRSMRALLGGETSRAQELQFELAAVAARIEDANAFHSLIAQSSILAWEMGTLEGRISGLVEGARRYPAISGFRAAVAWACAKSGRQEEATREFQSLAFGRFEDIAERFDWPTSVALCAEVACDLGDRERAGQLSELLEPLSNRLLFVGLGVASFGSTARLLARLAETMGRPDLAEAHFRSAIERNAAAGAHAWTAHSKFEYASLLARTGGAARRDYRVRLASEALETATDLGLVNLRRRVESFLEDARERPALQKTS